MALYSIGPCFYHQSYPQLGVVFVLVPSLLSFLSYFTQYYYTNFIHVPTDCKLGDTGIYIFRDIKQGTKMSWPKRIYIILNLFFYHHGIMLEISIKRYLQITHIFSNTMWHLPREIFNLVIKSLNKDRLKRTQEVIAEKKAFK